MACKCISKNDRGEQYGFKSVPGTLDEITAEWCEIALKNGSTISSDTKITSIEVKRFQNEITGVMDGGGFSGSTLVRINLQYGGNVTGNEPPSLVGKISLGSGYKPPMIWRLIMYAQLGSFDEYLYRQEIYFIQNVIPVMETSGYKHPKIYYSGINDQGDRGFVSAVVLTKPTNVKTVVLMEDMNGWKSSAVGILLTKEEAVLCLKNVAILHAKFWGEKENPITSMFKLAKPEKDFRPAAHSKFQAKFRKRYFSSSEGMQKTINKALASDWKTSKTTVLNSDALRPDWFTAEPLEDGSYPVFTDPMVIEMLGVLAKRGPDYNRKKLKPFLKKPVQTLLHGDFHGANHMYGQGDNEGKIVALDYQMAGHGRVATEFIYFFMLSLSAHNLEELMDLAKEYHYTLEEHGVTDYNLAEFKDDIEMMFIEGGVNFIGFMSFMKPKTLLSLADGFAEKGEDVKKLFENGIYGKFFILLTSIYLSNKEHFMSGEQE